MNVNPEVVAWDPVDDFSSGGGFSYYFPRPSYQDGIVPAYVAAVDPSYDGLYNKNGSGYPDISASGFISLRRGMGQICGLMVRARRHLLLALS
jgi:tripeptidyl-peptidase-1